MSTARPSARAPSAEEYRALAELRYRVRLFLSFSEAAARAAGLAPQQHQLLLAIKGLPLDRRPTIGVLAERLQLRHHSTVELADRLEERDLLRRRRAGADRREVELTLTRRGEALLARLSRAHQGELATLLPSLAEILPALAAGRAGARARRTEEVVRGSA